MESQSRRLARTTGVKFGFKGLENISKDIIICVQEVEFLYRDEKNGSIIPVTITATTRV